MIVEVVADADDVRVEGVAQSRAVSNLAGDDEQPERDVGPDGDVPPAVHLVHADSIVTGNSSSSSSSSSSAIRPGHNTFAKQLGGGEREKCFI